MEGRKLEMKQKEIAQEISLPILDKEIIDQLKAIGGADLVFSVFEDFVMESNELVDGSVKAYASGDIPTVKSNLHTLKGSAGTVGVSQIAEIAKDAEWRLKSDDTSTLSEALPQLQRAYRKFLDNYEELLSEWMK